MLLVISDRSGDLGDRRLRDYFQRNWYELCCSRILYLLVNSLISQLVGTPLILNSHRTVISLQACLKLSSDE